MHVYIFQMDWRGQRDFTVFVRGYERRRHRRRAPLQPQIDCTSLHGLTAEEVGQLLGGN